MKLPRSRVAETMHQVVRERSDTYTVTRQTGTTNVGMGETEQTTSTLTVDALLYSPSETSDMFEFGDRLDGDLNGVALPAADVQAGDEYDHGGDTYEVTTVDSRPSEKDNVLQRFALDRITNDR